MKIKRKVQRYHIECVADFLKVPEDRIKGCLRDLKIAIAIARAELEPRHRIGDPEGVETIRLMQSFTWIDDGKP